MSDKIFFSYSRSDSVFVLKLASDLRNAGANVWLDQLDIPPGTHWDKEIEEALQNANCLLAILSPKSLGSNNAMDEISYALEENKKVIPVLLTNTETPFRLRRLQRVDFTGDYKIALAQLLSALDIEKPAIAKMPKTTAAEPLSPGAALNKSLTEQKETNLWAEARKVNSIAAYQDYINKSTTQTYAEEAGYNIKKIEEAAAIPVEVHPLKSEKSFFASLDKKYMVVVAGLVLLAVFTWAAFKVLNKKSTIQPGSNKLASLPLKVDKEKDILNLTTQNTNTTAKTEIIPEPLPEIIEIEKKEKKHTIKVEKPRQKINKPSGTESTVKVNEPINQPPVTETPVVKIESELNLPSSSSAGKREIQINSLIRVNCALVAMPVVDKKRVEIPVKFLVTRDVTYGGSSIIRRGPLPLAV